MLLSGCSSCPAVGSVPSLVSFSFPFVFGFLATGGGIFVPIADGSVSSSIFVGEETAWLFCVATGLVSTTTFLVLLAKIKLAMLEGDLHRSGGDAGECELRRELGPPKDLAAVRKRIASCRFIEGDTEAAGGDLIVRDGTEVDDTVGTTRSSDCGAGGCAVTTADGGVGEGELIIRDFLMGFCGASVLEEEAGILFLMSTCGASASALLLTDCSSAVCRREGDTKAVDSPWTTVAGGTCGLWSSERAGRDSCFVLERSCTGKDGGKGMLPGADGAFCFGGGVSGLGWLEFSDGADLENSWPAGPSVFAPSGWQRSSVGGAGGIL